MSAEDLCSLCRITSSVYLKRPCGVSASPLCVCSWQNTLQSTSVNMLLTCRYFQTVKEINDQEVLLQSLTDEQLKAKTAEFRQRLKKGATVDNLLVEAFAVVREVSSRVLRLRHFDAQMVSHFIAFTAKFPHNCSHTLNVCNMQSIQPVHIVCFISHTCSKHIVICYTMWHNLTVLNLTPSTHCKVLIHVSICRLKPRIAKSRLCQSATASVLIRAIVSSQSMWYTFSIPVMSAVSVHSPDGT